MFDNPKSGNNRIIRDETYLTSNHDPEEPVQRKQEVKQITDALQPLTRRKTPENLLIHGPSGVGKTTCLKHIFQLLEDETRVKPVFINCWQYNTRSSLLTELLIKLGYPAPRKGKPVDELLAKLTEWLDKNRGIAIALDEFDQLQHKTRVAYDLHLVNSQAENNVGIVLVSNQPPSQLDLDPRCWSRLNLQTLEFDDYKPQELTEILEQRVEKAFHPGSVKEDIPEKIAEEIFEGDGDCREALELLLRAGRKAEQNGHNKLTGNLVDNLAE
jgi:cell division control protein 6